MFKPEEIALIKKLGGGGGSSGGGSGADLLNADGVIKQEHLPEGYPYKTVEEGYILEECQPIYLAALNAFGVTESLHFVEVGKEYTVAWNGTEHNCVVKIITNAPPQYASFIGWPALGNFAVVGGENTGEPFAILCVPEELVSTQGFAYGVIPLDGSTQITLSIKGIVPVYHPISEKYLSNMPVKINVESNINFDAFSCDKKFAEVYEKVLSGCDVIVFMRVGETYFVGRLSMCEANTIYFAFHAYNADAFELVFKSDETWEIHRVS